MKGYSAFRKAPALPERLSQIAQCHIQDTHWWRLTHLQRSSLCILHPKPTGPPGHSLVASYPSVEKQFVYSAPQADWATRTLIGGILLICREAVCVFCTSADRTTRTLIGGGSQPSVDIQSVCSAAPADWNWNSTLKQIIVYKLFVLAKNT